MGPNGPASRRWPTRSRADRSTTVTSGEVLLDGEDVSRSDRRRARPGRPLPAPCSTGRGARGVHVELPAQRGHRGARRCTGRLCCSRKVRSASITWPAAARWPRSSGTQRLVSRTVQGHDREVARSLGDVQRGSVRPHCPAWRHPARSRPAPYWAPAAALSRRRAVGEAHVAVLLQLVWPARRRGGDDPAAGEHAAPRPG